MKNKVALWLIIAICLILIGGILFVAAMMANHWDFNKVSNVKYHITTHQINDPFQHFAIETDTADITFAVSEDNICRIVCNEQEKHKHTVTVEDGTLSIRSSNERKWYEYIGISVEEPQIRIFLPETAYDNLTVKESTGDVLIPKDFTFASINITTNTGDIKNHASATGEIKILTDTGSITTENITAKAVNLSTTTGWIDANSITCETDLTLSVHTGKISLKNTKCFNLVSTGDTGDISLENVIATNQFSIVRTTGDVEFEDCDAGEIFIATDTGDVEGEFLSEKIFITTTVTGDVDVPKSVTGGRCEITTDTGDIEITIQ